jgi:dipeptidyl aminopeptidase/acylaminoacyl peptidase
MQAEFATPPWQFGMASYGFDAQGGMACAWQCEGRMHLSRLDAAGGPLYAYELPFQWFGSVQVHGEELLCVAGSPWQEMSVLHLHLRTGAHQVLKRGAARGAEPGFTSVPQAISYAGSGGHTTHALYYPPTNAQAHAPAGEKPPLLVLSHGGPTACASPVYRPALQYWTSRGFAVLDVNYGGSTGYGRAYRERLKGHWGVVDVQDCALGARHLAEQGLVDGRRLIIRGGSAGGFTTLAALTFTDVFAAGASLYGIGDLEALARDTHKFESRYLDSLIGPWPQAADVYRARSPIHHTAQLNCPIILFQGSDDLAVPPAQSRQMHAAVKAKGLPVAYIEFEGEGHGFRQAANIRRAIDAEAYFYAQVFGFELADAVEPVGIDNLPP